ncbi:hypothetical protein ES332_D04G142000v1 [Gossypium tomentosum]|uniref:Uncharacterized protein n=1 Tax=Gossypium tomentosum TaxID=34277 RepID=A0A5D2LDN4_GOSTO|nr:hypothetical protein ES332_D04G142000v1 [Gossypium tomentosum]
MLLLGNKGDISFCIDAKGCPLDSFKNLFSLMIFCSLGWN